jgi:hypothetical protein
MYREIREVQSTVEALQTHVRDALLSTSTRDMVEHTGRAQVSAVAAKEELDRLLDGHDADDPSSFGEPRVESRFVDAANRSLGVAITEAEKLTLGVDVDSMRARLVDFKTLADFADAYLQAAVGVDSES